MRRERLGPVSGQDHGVWGAERALCAMSQDQITFGIDPAAGNPERALAITYSPAERRPPLAALFALDATLAKLALGTREPLVAQLRLTWWHEALDALAAAPPPAQPILRALQRARVDGAALAAMASGWERLLDDPDDAALEGFARARGGLFAVAADLLGASDAGVAAAGQGWALADLSLVSGRRATREAAARLAAPLLASACAARWSGAGRTLGALAHSARLDLAMRGQAGAPPRIARLAWHRMTGR